MKDESFFVTQKSKRRDQQLGEDAANTAVLDDLLVGVAQASQSTRLLRKRKEMREVCWSCRAKNRSFVRMRLGRV